MAQDTTPALVMYIGDGTQTRFEVPFDKGAYGEIKVAFVRRGLTDYTYDPTTYTVDGYLYAWNGGVYTKTEQVDTSTPLYDKDGVATGNTWVEGMYREPKNDIFTQAVVEWTGDTLTSNDVICIVRESAPSQPYSYPNNQKHIERALDNLSRQIQEIAKKSQNALLVDPSWMSVGDGGVADENKLDPVAWLQTIVRSKGKTLRELRVDSGYIAYTADDPDATSKTWNVIAGVGVDNAGVISHIREHQDTVNGVTIKRLQYSVDGGTTWRNSDNLVCFSELFGAPTDNTALANALNAKQDTIADLDTIRSGAAAGATAVQPGDLATVATTGAYDDLNGKPTLGTAAAFDSTDFATAAQGAKADSAVQPGDLATVATTGAYSDLTGTPTIPTVGNATITIAQGGVAKGTFTTNQTLDTTIEIDAGGGGGGTPLPDQTGHSGEFLTTNGTAASWASVPVTSVNNKTGAVTLSASDVGALPDSTTIPDAQIQSDWDQSDNTKVDYIKNKPTIPAAQVNSDWNAVAGIAQILNKPTIPTVNDSTITITQGGVTKGSFTLNQASGDTIALDAGGGSAGQSIDADIVGTLTINGAIVSGFSSSNYLKLPGIFILKNANNFELVTGFTTKSSIGEERLIDHLATGGITLTVNSSGKLLFGVSDSSGLQSLQIIQGTTVLSVDTKYYVKIQYDGTDYTLLLSTDGINYTQEGTVAETTLPADTEIVFGKSANVPEIIHLDSCYIKKDGVIIWQGMDVPGLHQRAPKGHEVIEFQAPTAGNNYTWYRKYADGWVEQGQFNFTLTKNTTTAVTLPVEMADIQYGGQINCANTTYNNATTLSINKKSTTQVNLWGYTSASDNTISVHWEVKGMAQ